MKYRRVLAILSILAAVLWLLLRPSEHETFASEKTASSSDSRTASTETKIENPNRHSEATGSKAQDQHLSRHDANQLKDFILPHLEGKELSLREALGLLNEAYLNACYQSQEKPLALQFLVKDEPGHSISFSLRGRSFLTCLQHLAALSGLAMERQELNFELFRSETANQSRDIIFPNANAIKKQLRALAGLKPEEGEEDWESLLRYAGFIQETGTRLSISDGFLKVSGTQAEVARVQSGINLAGEPPVQIKIVTKLVSTNSPVDIPRSSLTDAELQFLMRDLAQQPGTQFTTYPSATAKEGDPLTIEVIRETTRNGQPDWTGMRGTYQTERTGLKITAYDQSESREESRKTGWLKETDSAIYSGDTHLQLVSTRNGVYQYRLLTVTATDSSGHPLGNARSEPAAE